MALWISVNEGSSNGLLPNGTKPLPELMLDLPIMATRNNISIIFHQKLHFFIADDLATQGARASAAIESPGHQ